MKTIISTLLLLLFAGPALTQESCRSDVGGTWKSGQGELASEGTLLCHDCREVNHHMADYRNTMWNWAALGRGTDLFETAATSSVGRYVFDLRLAAVDVIVPVWGNIGASNVMSMPICNTHGQCVTGTIRVNHTYVRTPYCYYGWCIGVSSGIRDITVMVDTPNGRHTEQNYSKAKLTADRRAPGYTMPVPADTARDFAPNGSCLNNLGQHRPPDREMRPPSGGGNDSGDDPYDRWWDEEAAYGGRSRLLCGWESQPNTGDNTWVCGWFW